MAQAAAQAQPTTTKPEKKKKALKNTLLKTILVCTINAHMHNKTYPGTYNTKLNYLLAKNSIPYTDVGDEWDSNAILEAIENDVEVQDMETEEEEEETIIRSSPPPPNFSLPPSDSPPFPEADLPLVDKSLDSFLQGEDSFGETTTPEKENKKKKKKKNKKKVTSSPVTGENPSEIQVSFEQKENEEAETSSLPTLSLTTTQEMEEEEVEETRSDRTYDGWTDDQMDDAAEDYIYQNQKLSDSERLIVYEYFERLTQSRKFDPPMLPELYVAILSYWAVVLHTIDSKVERDAHIDTRLEAMNLFEIEEFEEKYIQISKDRYGFRILMDENKERFKELVRKKELSDGEQKELRELFRSCAQTRHGDYQSHLTFSCLLSFYRTSGVPLTLYELRDRCKGRGYLWLKNLISKELLQAKSQSALLKTLAKPLTASGV